MAIAFLRRCFLENPLVRRQLATHLTGPRLGLAFFLIAGSLLAADVMTFAVVLRSNDAIALEGHAGGPLYGVNSIVLYGLLACLVPIRVSGAIDGPRFDKAFDQLVVTGVSPGGLQLGNWGLGLLFAAFVLIVSLPFQVYACMLGGVGFTDLLVGYAVLAIYTNVIIAVTLAAAVIEREWLGVPAAIGFFCLAGALAFAPIPNVFAWATPVRFFLDPRVLERWARPPRAAWFFDDPVLFLQSVPLNVYPFLLWGLIVLPCVVIILLGPSHRFLPGLNNFGNVVLPGDRKRRFFRRTRLALTRKVELAFFYENRPRWLDGWDFPARVLLVLGLVTFVWAVAVGLFFHGAPQIDARLELWKDELQVACMCVTGMILFFAILGLGDPRFKLEWRERIGKWSVPRGWLRSLCVFVLLAGFLLLHGMLLRSSVANGLVGPATVVGSHTLESYGAEYWGFLESLAIFLLNFHLLGKVVTRLSNTIAGWRIVMLLAAGAALFGPLIAAIGIEEHWMPRELFPIIFISPFSQLAARDRSFARIGPPGFNVDEMLSRHWTWQLGFTAALVSLIAALTLLSMRRRNLPGATAALVLLGALSFVAAPGVRGATAEKTLPLEVTITVGFEGQLLDARAFFFTLVLRNTSEKTIRGKFRIEFDGRYASLSRDFEAPAGTTVPIRWVDGESDAYLYGVNGQLILEAPEGRSMVDVPSANALATQNLPDGASRYLVVDEDGRKALREREQLQSWAYAKPFYLPEDHRMYGSVTTVFVGPTDLSRWTQGQRRALYDFVRAGGAVVFYGAFDRATLKGAGEWETILTPRTSTRVVREGVEYVVDELDDARTLVWLEAVDGGSAAPLLSGRALGPGFVGRMSCDLQNASLSRKLWSSLWETMPRSQYPTGLSRSHEEDLELRDSTSFLAVLGYFSFYALVAGPVGFFAFRRKSRRRWLPIWMVALPAAFVLLLPALHAWLHFRPSYAALTQVAMFGPDARRGVVLAHLDVRSSGRQHHALKLRGDNLSAFNADSITNEYERYPPRRSRFQEPLALLGGDDGERALQLPTNPWSRSTVFFLGDARRDVPIQGKALFDQRTRRLSLQAVGLPVSGGTPNGQLALRLPGEDRYRVASLSAGKYSEGVFTLELAADPISTEVAAALRSRGILGPARLAFDMPNRPFVALALETDDPDACIRVETNDLAFEREVDPAELEPSVKRRPIAEASASRVDFERDGKHFRSFKRTLILQELPLEIR